MKRNRDEIDPQKKKTDFEPPTKKEKEKEKAKIKMKENEEK